METRNSQTCFDYDAINTLTNNIVVCNSVAEDKQRAARTKYQRPTTTRTLSCITKASDPIGLRVYHCVCVCLCANRWGGIEAHIDIVH